MKTARHERDKIYVYGKHAFSEALLHAPQIIRKVFLSTEAANDRDLREMMRHRNIPFTMMKGREADHMVGKDTVHQGVIVAANPMSLMIDFSDFVQRLTPDPDAMVVILDELTDPHNVGAIIRSAAAFGARGVLLPSHRQASITGAVVKASVGMAFRVPLVSIGSVNQAIDTLKKNGFKIYALAMDGTRALGKEVFEAPAAFVVGNEGRGIHEKTLERADVTLRIPMNPRCESLNASVSAAVVLYEWSKAHPAALRDLP